MAILGVRIPHDISRIFGQIEVPLLKKEEREPFEMAHVTLFYLGERVPIDQLAKTVVATYSVTSKAKPFTVMTNRTTAFPPHPEHGTVPIICPITSSDIHELHASLRAALDRAGVAYNKTFKEFRPHVTLGYVSDPLVYADHAADMDIPLIEWGIADIVLWGGEEGDQRFSANFPLSLGKTASNHDFYLALVRIAHLMKPAHDENGQCATTCPCHIGHPDNHASTRV